MKKRINIDKKYPMLSFNARLLLKELDARGIDFKSMGKTDLIESIYRNHKEVFYSIFNNHFSYPLGLIIDDKYYSKQLLKQLGFKVTNGNVFSKKNIPQALDYASEIGFPVVLKPTTGTHGLEVYMGIDNSLDLEKKIKLLLKSKIGNGYYLIEKQENLNEYRLFITKNKFFAAVSRIPANITGDGKNNLLNLIKKENYKRMHPRNNCLCEIKVDFNTRDFLKKNNINLQYVPKKKEKILLRQNSNVSTGGNCYEVTDIVHPGFIKLAINILNTIDNIPYLGIDLLCNDISKKPKDYFICELNSCPGLSLHMMPETGKPKNVAGAIVDVIFPETKYEK